MGTTKIDSYLVIYSSGDHRPQVWLLSGNSYLGQAAFVPDDEPLPAGTPRLLFYHRSDFPAVVDLLRNEAPVFLHTTELADGSHTALMTGVESVGEGEISRLFAQRS